jgi:BASS family bile acid:Na+ symporter
MALDVEFTLLTLIICSALSPLTTVAFSYLFLGTSLFSPIDLGIKLFFFYAASGAAAFAIRRVAGQRWIERQKDHIDGLNVIAVFVFAIVAMASVPHQVMADPLFAAALLGLILVLSCLLIGVSMLVFLRAGTGIAMVIGMLATFRNIGLVMATLGTVLPDTAWFYFGLVQFPIYLFPLALKPLARRLAPPR